MMKKIIGIIGAMESEVDLLCKSMFKNKKTVISGISFYSGMLDNQRVVIVKSGIGKVNAAICTQILINNFSVTHIINTGIAGAMAKNLKVFDFVVSSSVVYHDVDLTAFNYKYGQIPQMPEQFNADETLVDVTFNTFEQMSFKNKHEIAKGLIASGDSFINTMEKKNQIKKYFNPLCVEMEGAAIAHVCHMNKIPFVIIRCLSDMADESVKSTYKFNEDICAQFCANFVIQVIDNFNKLK